METRHHVVVFRACREGEQQEGLSDFSLSHHFQGSEWKPTISYRPSETSPLLLFYAVLCFIHYTTTSLNVLLLFLFHADLFPYTPITFFFFFPRLQSPCCFVGVVSSVLPHSFLPVIPVAFIYSSFSPFPALYSPTLMFLFSFPVSRIALFLCSILSHPVLQCSAPHSPFFPLQILLREVSDMKQRNPWCPCSHSSLLLLILPLPPHLSGV